MRLGGEQYILVKKREGKDGERMKFNKNERTMRC